MADDLIMNPGSGGGTLRADQLLTGQYVPYSKIMDGTADSTNVLVVDSSGRAKTVADAGTGPWPVTDNGGSLTVDDGGGSLTVDGTVAVSGTTAISAASLPLPSGAATAAKQPALGTAGSPSADVLTVQGSSSGTALPVQGLPGTSGGYSINRLLAAATTNATSVKASAGQLYGWYLFNASAATKYLKIYNKASAPTVGTDTPVMTIPIPAGAAANVEYENGIAFATGIAFALTGGLADSDTTALAANDVIVNLFYK